MPTASRGAPKAASPNGVAQRPLVDPELGREFVEGEQFVLALVRGDCLAGASMNIRRCRSAAAVPRT